MTTDTQISPHLEATGKVTCRLTKITAQGVLGLLTISRVRGLGNSHSTTQAAESKDKKGEKEVLPAVSESHVQDHLKNLKVCKSVGHNKACPQVLR